mgnify:CR=1 FL=1
MNIFRRTWSAIRSKVSGLYEAARQTFSDSSWLFGKTYQDAWRDYTECERTELVSKHRYWVANSSLVQRIRSLNVQFAVGPTGLSCTPNSKDETWNDVRAEHYQKWARSPEICSRNSLSTLAIQWAGSLFDDGEYFVLLLQEGGKPYLQTVEAHRCKTPPHLKDQEGKTIIDGIEIDSFMRPTHYWFADGPTSTSLFSNDREQKFKRYPASVVRHGFKSRRPGQMRGVPEGFSGHNTLHNYEDLHRLEMRAAKKIASNAIVVTNATGEADPTQLRRERFNIASANAGGTTTTKERALYFEQKLGGETVYVKNGEKVENFKCDRPSIVTQQHWDLLVSEICCAYNTPKLLVMPFSLQGTVTRADLDVCSNAFRFNFEVIAQTLRDIYEWQAEWAVKYDLEFRKALWAASVSNSAPPDYQCVVVRPPRPPDVDVGYNANALKIELALGTKTYQDVFAERQQNWQQAFRDAAESAFYLKKLAKEFSKDGITVTPDEIAQKIEAVAVAPIQPEQEEPQTARTAATA